MITWIREHTSKGLVGFVFLACGFGYAIAGNSNALEDSKERGQVTRGIIGTILTESDEQGVHQLPAEAKLLHVSLSDLERFSEANLERTAGYRKELQPCRPETACSATPVKIK